MATPPIDDLMQQAQRTPLGIDISDYGDEWRKGFLSGQLNALVYLHGQGYAVVPEESDHFVTFDLGGWFIEHSVACRLAGTLGTCAYNDAVRRMAEDGPPDELGRFRLDDIDPEGFPMLERVEEDAT